MSKYAQAAASECSPVPPEWGRTSNRRPCPPNFRERYIEFGWDGQIEVHYRTNWRCIKRWIEESGGDELRRARAEHVKRVGPKRLHSAG